MIDACLIREELQRSPIELTDEEIQEAVDGLRRTNKLFTIADTMRWMRERGLDHDQLEQLASDNYSVLKLRERITAGKVEAYFDAHRADFDTVYVARIDCTDAETLKERLDAGELAFFDAAQEQYLAAPEHERMSFATLRRRDCSTEAMFSAKEGDTVATTESVVKVLRVKPAQLDATTRTAIEELLFQEWLAERRRTAKITWHWGRADRTPDAA